jgi:SAM-dependent methyltransferase
MKKKFQNPVFLTKFLVQNKNFRFKLDKIMSVTNAEQWAISLESWAIPEAIISQATESPWIHPPALFLITDAIAETVSHQIAREALPEGGSVLDIGCGGGVAAFALSDKAKHVIGVDHQTEMLKMFSENALKRNLTFEVFEGFWPALEKVVPIADVTTCYNVVYNVQQIVPFLEALDAHTKKRVVIEMPIQHPLANMDKAWQHFWNLARPKGPTPNDLIAVLVEIGITAKVKYWAGEVRQESDLNQAAEFMRIRLCLPKERFSDVKDFFASLPIQNKRDLATIWWDK